MLLGTILKSLRLADISKCVAAVPALALLAARQSGMSPSMMW
jgi:hypothetical protein